MYQHYKGENADIYNLLQLDPTTQKPIGAGFALYVCTKEAGDTGNKIVQAAMDIIDVDQPTNEKVLEFRDKVKTLNTDALIWVFANNVSYLMEFENNYVTYRLDNYRWCENHAENIIG